MALLEVITIGLIVGQYAYHRLTEKAPPKPSDRIEVPQTEEGAAVPLIFGRCRINRPVLAWQGDESSSNSGTSPSGAVFTKGLLYVLGIPFFDGTTRLHGVFLGDRRMAGMPLSVGPNINGTPYLVESAAPLTTDDVEFVQFQIEFGSGISTQDMGTSLVASAMGVPSTEIPGFRGYATAYLDVSAYQTTFPSIAFDASSYPTTQLYPAFIATTIGDEANPADVIAALLCDRMGKLGQTPSETIHYPSFRKVGETLASEGFGYSRAWDERTPTREIIDDVLRTVDGVAWQEQDDGLWHIKLIRPDYDPVTAPKVHPGNCERLEDLDAGSWDDLPNKIRVVYPRREDEYRENSATAQVMGGDAEVNELVLRFPGVCTKEQAEVIAARELGARSQPLLQCRAIVDRSFWETRIGDVVELNWPDLNISQRMMRVGNVGFGAHDANVIVLDLIEDYFYVYRRKVTHLPPVAPFPTEAVPGA